VSATPCARTCAGLQPFERGAATSLAWTSQHPRGGDVSDAWGSESAARSAAGSDRAVRLARNTRTPRTDIPPTSCSELRPPPSRAPKETPQECRRRCTSAWVHPGAHRAQQRQQEDPVSRAFHGASRTRTGDLLGAIQALTPPETPWLSHFGRPRKDRPTSPATFCTWFRRASGASEANNQPARGEARRGNERNILTPS
jgi:hypothetical protein